MRVEVKVPQLPESVAEATLVNWHKKIGEAVARDENLVDVETDKVCARASRAGCGVLAEIRKGDGSTVAGQEVIAVLDSDGSAAAVAAPAGGIRAAEATTPAAAPGRARAFRRRRLPPRVRPQARRPQRRGDGCPRRQRYPRRER
jgi:2-oxoglutarate dehydrogenase E2 component (dihydrolipoamide succinyltransferase)